MTSRRASEGAGSVLSFTFLDVLMCTMGSLLLLLVVFGVIAKKARMRREGEVARVSLAALKAPGAQPTPAPGGDDPAAEKPPADDPAELARQLEQVRGEQAKIDQLRTEAADRRRQGRDRIAHLEDHERRLEHELAQLHLTLEALEATEQKQTVDQTQAEAEVKRLKELVKETEARLAEMRKEGASDKSYAIVPYKGKNGTFRRPVFVECTEEAVTIQPEGIRLTVEDFDGPLRSGNPLAAAIRAAHEELNARAVAAGQADMPDPYPLLIVRPNGAAAYAAALDAIRSWDSDYGYEFVESDWKLKYAEPDPRLGQVMSHAVDEARQRQALLAKVAPRRYASRLSNGGAGGGAGGTGGAGIGGGNGGSGGGGFDALAYGGGSDGMGPHAAGGPLGGDGRNSLRGSAGRGASNGGNFSDEFSPPDKLTTGGGANGQGGAGTNGLAGGRGGSGVAGLGGSGGGADDATGGGTAADGAGGPNAQGTDANSRYAAGNSGGAGSTATQGQGGRYGDPSTTGSAARGANQTGGGNSNSMAGGSAPGGAASAGGAAGGSAGAGSGSAAGSSSSSMGSSLSSGGGAAAADASNANAGPPSASYTKTIGSKSAADTRGVNWANAEASRRASAVTRPVKVLVSPQQLSVLGDGANPDIVSFQQPTERVMDQLAGAVQEHIRDWGLAGDNMYWRPTLVLSVAPGAERQAQRLAELLENSGLDVHLPQSTATAPQGAGHATR
jgi:hypothetical protein